MNDTAPVDWRAEWIWQGDEPAPYHFFLFARRSFDLPAVPRSALLHVTATDLYRVYVNGRHLGRGPERCDPRFQSFDTYDVTSLLVPGRNCVAIQAYFYGCHSSTGRDGRAGLFAQLDGDGATLVATDQAWKVRAAKGWRRDVRTVGIGVGVTEVRDARLDPPDWMETSFDDSSWEQAALVPINSGQWCSRPEPRHIPFMDETEVFPVAVLRTGETLELDDTLSTPDVPEMLAREVHEELRRATLQGAETITGAAKGGCDMRAATSAHAVGDDVFDGIRDPFVLLDFGRQINAFPRVVFEAEPGDIVDVAYGEQLIGGRIMPLVGSVRAADRYIARAGLQACQSWEYRSFRYLQVSFRTGGAPVRVRSVSAVTWRYPAPVRGAFSCSNPTLTKLWSAAAATTDLCTDDAFMDTPFREKRNWLGDGSHILLGVFAAWGNVPVISRYFQLVQQGLLGDGMMRMSYPGSDWVDQKTRIISLIPQHTFVWAARVMEFYRLFGGEDFLAGLYPTLRGLAGWCDRHVNPRGLLDRLPYGCWLDWTPADIRGANLGTNAFYLHMLDDLAVMAGILGRRAETAGWEERAARVRAALREQFWDEARGFFVDSVFRGRQTGIASQLGNALALLYDVADARQAGLVAERLTSNEPAFAPSTPLFFHYIPEALFGAGRPEAAIRLIVERFSRMMESSQTIWEGWSRHAMLPQITENDRDVPAVVPNGRFDSVKPGYRPAAISLAHCGGLGSGLLLLTEVLGIAPQKPGFDGCVVSPKIDVLPSARGTFPSPRGDITVGWETTGSVKKIHVAMPADLEGELRLPSGQTRALPAGTRTDIEVPVRGAPTTSRT